MSGGFTLRESPTPMPDNTEATEGGANDLMTTINASPIMHAGGGVSGGDIGVKL
jgi:hypothetical protein